MPTAAVIDSPTVRAADTVPTASNGYDDGEIEGRDGAFRITAALREAFSAITLVWADAGPPPPGSSATDSPAEPVHGRSPREDPALQRSVTGRCSNPRSVCRSRRTGRPDTRRWGKRSVSARSATAASSRARPAPTQ